MDQNNIWREQDGIVVLTDAAAACLSRPVVTCSTAMEEQLAVLKSAADTSLRVLISGEPGTQKQQYAEYLHRCSNRAGKSYVRFDCAATRENRLETTLFGRDAMNQSYAVTGLAETAHGGTLLLDGVNALPTEFYPKLEQFLDSGLLRPQGSRSARPVDVRVVSICGQDVTAFVNQEPQAAALMQKLGAVRIDVLPLRRRPEDIALLTVHTLQQANKRYQSQKALGSRLFRAMLDYGWPGNERELHSFIEQLVLVSPAAVLDDPAMLQATSRLSAALTPGLGQQTPPKQPSLREMVNAYEQMLIQQNIRKYGSLRKAAKMLGVAPSVLSRKLAAEKQRDRENQ